MDVEALQQMPEDFEPTVEAEEIEWAFDETTDIEYLNGLCYAYSTADGVNPLTEADKARKDRIMRRSLILIDRIVKDIYFDFKDREEAE